MNILLNFLLNPAAFQKYYFCPNCSIRHVYSEIKIHILPYINLRKEQSQQILSRVKTIVLFAATVLRHVMVKLNRFIAHLAYILTSGVWNCVWLTCMFLKGHLKKSLSQQIKYFLFIILFCLPIWFVFEWKVLGVSNCIILTTKFHIFKCSRYFIKLIYIDIIAAQALLQKLERVPSIRLHAFFISIILTSVLFSTNHKVYFFRTFYIFWRAGFDVDFNPYPF